MAAPWDQPVAAVYPTAGTRRVKVRVDYTTRYIPGVQSGSYESHFDLEVTGSDYVANRYADPGLVQTFAPRPGIHSGGSVHVRFGSTRTQSSAITRPLIVAEGYDVYSVAPSVVESNYGIGDFMEDIRDGLILEQLENAGGPGGAAAPIGYDIVFIDYTNGTDDIRRNAALFREVVEWVNSVKVGGTATGQRNVVLGISMGGLVARYGLAQMEKATPGSTHTRLLVTHDSPHRGANTPLGLQALTRQAAGSTAAQFVRTYNSAGVIRYLPMYQVFPQLEQADRLLDAPATQQLLLIRATRLGAGPVSIVGSQANTFLDTEYRAMITPTAGQSFPYEFVATSLGSECGRELFAPHTELIRVAGKGYLTAGLVGTSFNTEVIVNAMPQGGAVERLSSLRIWNQTTILGIRLPRVYFANSVYHSPASNPFPWDGLPGGTQSIRSQAPLEPTNRSGWWFAFAVVGYRWEVRLADDFCFVPRASALDVRVLNDASLRGVYSNGLRAGSESQARDYIGQGQFMVGSVPTFNSRHPFFPARQAQWLFNEIQLNPQPNNLTDVTQPG